MHDRHIYSKYVTRVEGHGNILLDVKNGEIKELKLEIIESPRFFEAMIRGRRYDEVSLITSRICGICAVSHTTASIRATETALGVEVSEQTKLLRRLLFHGEMIQNHILHLYFLAAPDFFRVGSVIPLIDTHREVVERALRLKKLGNRICEVIGGRHVHPITPTVGGFTRVPAASELKGLKTYLESHKKDLQETVNLMKTVKLPEFTRETEYLALKTDGEYAYIDGDIGSTEGDTTPVKKYKDKVKEYIVPHSSAKHARGTRDSYMVGALARLNNHFAKLSPGAKKVAAQLDFKVPNHNPFANNLAQLIETVHCFEESLEIIDRLLERGLKEDNVEVKVGAGRGVGAVEAPRGTLYHEYEYDEQGRCVNANCIIPTAQNLANIEADMRALVPQIINESESEIQFLLEMLVRAYDPCISCSTHFLKVDFVR